MKNLFFRRFVSALFAAILFSLFSPSNVSAVPIYALTKAGELVLFDSQKPYDFTHSVTVTGLQPNELVLAIDFRPATLQLYALGSTSRLYVLNTTTGAASQVGSGQFAPLLNGTFFGFDFDPVADRARVVSDKHQNLLLHPETGAMVAVYEPTAYAPGDVNAGGSSEVTGLAYTNNFAGATTTTLYGFDYAHNGLLVKIDPLDSGKLRTVGRVVVGYGTGDAWPDDKFAAFDIADTGTAYMAVSFIDMDAGPMLSFFTVDLATAATSGLGAIGKGEFIRSIAVNPAGLATPPPTLPNPDAPVLLRELNSPLAVALDSVTMKRNPFYFESYYNMSSDKRTRLMLFATNVDLMGADGTSVITAEAEVYGVVRPLIVEFVGSVPNVDGLTQINVKFPDSLNPCCSFSSTPIWVSIRLRGLQSNQGLVMLWGDVL